MKNLLLIGMLLMSVASFSQRNTEYRITSNNQEHYIVTSDDEIKLDYKVIDEYLFEIDYSNRVFYFTRSGDTYALKIKSIENKRGDEYTYELYTKNGLAFTIIISASQKRIVEIIKNSEGVATRFVVHVIDKIEKI